MDLKELKTSQTVSTFIGQLFYSRDAAHLMHLKTNSYAVHVALNDYYTSILDFVDTLVETYQGENELLKLSIPSCSCGDDDPIMYFKRLSVYINNNRNLFTSSYHQNIIDEILELINKTLYKLRFLK